MIMSGNRLWKSVGPITVCDLKWLNIQLIPIVFVIWMQTDLC